MSFQVTHPNDLPSVFASVSTPEDKRINPLDSQISKIGQTILAGAANSSCEPTLTHNEGSANLRKSCSRRDLTTPSPRLIRQTSGELRTRSTSTSSVDYYVGVGYDFESTLETLAGQDTLKGSFHPLLMPNRKD